MEILSPPAVLTKDYQATWNVNPNNFYYLRYTDDPTIPRPTNINNLGGTWRGAETDSYQEMLDFMEAHPEITWEPEMLR